MNEQFANQLQDICYAGKQLVKALPKRAASAKRLGRNDCAGVLRKTPGRRQPT